MNNTIRIACLFLLTIFYSFQGYSQPEKRSITVDDLLGWKHITSCSISDDGRWIAVEVSPWEGDPEVILYGSTGEQVARIPLGRKSEFSSSSGYLSVSVGHPKELTDSLKLLKTKKDDMPMNSLLLLSVEGERHTIDSVRSYKTAGGTDWVAYQRGTKKDSTLHVRSMDGEITREFKYVTDYGFSQKGSTLYFISDPKADSLPSGIYIYDTSIDTVLPILEVKGELKQPAFDKNGNNLAFLLKCSEDSLKKEYSVYIASEGGPARMLIEDTDPQLPQGWIISKEARLQFSENSGRLYLGLAPRPLEADTTVLAEYRPDVHIWTWNEPVQYPQQDHDRDRDLKKSYTAVVHLDNGRLVPLATPDMPYIINTPHMEAPVVLGCDPGPYLLESTWRGRNSMDLYTIDVKTREVKPVADKLLSRPNISPEGKYAYWYSPLQECWIACSIKDGRQTVLSLPDGFIFWDEEYDMPDHPDPHGVAGWTVGDRDILVYDRYDLWMLDPEGKRTPANLTRNGRDEGIVYRMQKTDREETNIDPKKRYIFTAFDEKAKTTSLVTLRLDSGEIPVLLAGGNCRIDRLAKAKDAERIVFTKETFTTAPDIWSTDINAPSPVKITGLDTLQAPYRWGTAELVSWNSLDGKTLEGVVYKPEDFDPSKKYPLLVNFYDRNSESLYSYRTPQPHRSTIDYHMYNSNGYVIFNPDVVYETGYPGESCYNCVMPGIMTLIGEGYIDRQAIGAQGHSWGGYQVAYLATRTRLFAAIESGAPVVNMFSAYSGIRGESGRSRMFQYEHGQSRIGGSLWDYPERYIENSPLFTMDKVETPILIMHNDADGHVPWSQGVEYFMALRRLQKPAWLLNYTGEIHWPERMANRADFQTRMFQFFEHYLKNRPMPQWMQEGIPAIDRSFTLGY